MHQTHLFQMHQTYLWQLHQTYLWQLHQKTSEGTGTSSLNSAWHLDLGGKIPGKVYSTWRTMGKDKVLSIQVFE